MTWIRPQLALACLLLALPALALAGGGAGVAAADFLELPVGPRDIAMGGATVAVPGDISSLLRNPALLACDAGYRLYLGHQEWYQGLQHESAVLGLPLPASLGRAAGHLRYLHLAPLPAYDGAMQVLGEVDVYDLALGLSWARRFQRRLDAGASVHAVHEYLAGVEGRGWALDLGLGMVAAGCYWSASARNLGAGLDYPAEHFDLEREFNLGAARYFPLLSTILSLEYRQPQFWGSSLRGGAEYQLNERLLLRAGYAYTTDLDQNAGQPSIGLGLRLAAIGLDYSFLSQPHLGDIHSIGLRLMARPGVVSPYRFFRPSI